MLLLGYATYVGPGDIMSGAYAWWGLRAYNAATAGTPAIDLVDQAGANQVTISTKTDGTLNNAAITAWILANSVTAPKVKKLYDQTGNGRHLTQATLANMPDFILANPAFGNQRPTMNFRRANGQQLVSGAIALNQTTGSFSCVGMRNGAFNDGNGLISTGSGGWGIVFSANADTVFPFSGSLSNTVYGTAFSSHRFQAVFNGSSSFISSDGQFTAPASPGTSAFDSFFTLGNGWGGRFLTGTISEGGYWTSVWSTPDVLAMDANQKNYWFPKRGTAYEGLVALRCRKQFTGDTTNKYVMSRSAHIATESLTSIAVGFNALVSAVITASIEYPAATFTQLKFAGSASGIAEITDPVALLSDYVSVSIPNGATFWVRMYYVGATNQVTYNSWQNTFLGEAVTLSTTALTDATMGGTITNSGAFSCPPSLILGVTSNPSALAMGDSICQGVEWGDVEDTSNSATGYNARVGTLARSFPSGIPFVNYGEPGVQAPEAQYIRGVPKFSHVFQEFGINNFNAASETSAQVIANLALSLTLAQPFSKNYQTTMTPVSSAGVPGACNAQRVIFNDALRAGTTGLSIEGYLEVADVLETARDSGLWNLTYQGDVLHPNAAGYAAVQAANLIPAVSW